MRSAIKKTRIAITETKTDEAAASLSVATRLLDKAVSKGIIHKNNAARKISRLTTQATALTQS
jgi:small subunit ribosomal protein S20